MIKIIRMINLSINFIFNESHLVIYDVLEREVRTTVLIINPEGEIIARSYFDIKQLYPRPGWVSHDVENI